MTRDQKLGFQQVVPSRSREFIPDVIDVAFRRLAEMDPDWMQRDFTLQVGPVADVDMWVPDYLKDAIVVRIAARPHGETT